MHDGALWTSLALPHILRAMSVLPSRKTYDDVYTQFRWNIPARYNIGVDVCDRWARREPDRLAILHVRRTGAASR